MCHYCVPPKVNSKLEFESPTHFHSIFLIYMYQGSNCFRKRDPQSSSLEKERERQ